MPSFCGGHIPSQAHNPFVFFLLDVRSRFFLLPQIAPVHNLPGKSGSFLSSLSLILAFFKVKASITSGRQGLLATGFHKLLKMQCLSAMPLDWHDHTVGRRIATHAISLIPKDHVDHATSTIFSTALCANETLTSRGGRRIFRCADPFGLLGRSQLA